MSCQTAYLDSKQRKLLLRASTRRAPYTRGNSVEVSGKEVEGSAAFPQSRVRVGLSSKSCSCSCGVEVLRRREKEESKDTAALGTKAAEFAEEEKHRFNHESIKTEDGIGWALMRKGGWLTREVQGGGQNVERRLESAIAGRRQSSSGLRTRHRSDARLVWMRRGKREKSGGGFACVNGGLCGGARRREA